MLQVKSEDKEDAKEIVEYANSQYKMNKYESKKKN